MSISRRTALAAGPAIAAVAALPALPADATTLDAQLFAAIARWREVHDAYMAERVRQDAIFRQVDAEMPDSYHAIRSYQSRLEATPRQTWTREQHHRFALAEARLEPHHKARLRRLQDAGYNENKVDRMLDACTNACNEAFQTPAQTIAGLLAKMEMKIIEYPDDSFALDSGVNTIVADLRHVAAMA